MRLFKRTMLTLVYPTLSESEIVARLSNGGEYEFILSYLDEGHKNDEYYGCCANEKELKELLDSPYFHSFDMVYQVKKYINNISNS